MAELNSTALSLSCIEGRVDVQHGFASSPPKGSEVGIRFEFQLESGIGRRDSKLRLLMSLRL